MNGAAFYVRQAQVLSNLTRVTQRGTHHRIQQDLPIAAVHLAR